MKNTKQTYLAPAVEVMKIAVEQGFLGSNSTSPANQEEIGGVKTLGEW